MQKAIESLASKKSKVPPAPPKCSVTIGILNPPVASPSSSTIVYSIDPCLHIVAVRAMPPLQLYHSRPNEPLNASPSPLRAFVTLRTPILRVFVSLRISMKPIVSPIPSPMLTLRRRRHLLFVSHLRRKIFCQTLEFEVQSMPLPMQASMATASRVDEQLRRIRLDSLVKSSPLIDFVASKLQKRSYERKNVESTTKRRLEIDTTMS